MSEVTQNYLSTLHVNQLDAKGLPLVGIDSRLATAIIFSYYDRSKGVIKLGLVLSKKARAFVITQREILAGFISVKHNNVHSWLFEIGLSIKCMKDLLGFLSTAELDRIQDEIFKLMTTEPKEALLRNDHLGTYLTQLRDPDKEGQIPRMEDCNYENYTKCCIAFQIEDHHMRRTG